jgi:hypothetical protein
MLKNPVLKVNLNKIKKIISTCTKCSIFQNGLHADEILIFQELQLSRALKNTYVLSNYEFYNHNIFNILYEIGLNTILTQLISNVFSTHFYDTQVVQILYPTSHALNLGPYGF